MRRTVRQASGHPPSLQVPEGITPLGKTLRQKTNAVHPPCHDVDAELSGDSTAEAAGRESPGDALDGEADIIIVH